MAIQKKKNRQTNKHTNKTEEHSIKRRAYSIYTQELKKEVLVGVRCQKKNFASLTRYCLPLFKKEEYLGV